jgi:hypothetical protein
MKRLFCGFIMTVLICLVFTGCNLKLPGSANLGNPDGSAAPSGELQSATPENAAATPSAEEPKNATWVMEIDDTQEYTDELGIIWNYTLTLHASKPGGTDVTGEYAGDAVLKIEPDFESVQSAAAREGTELLSMIFNYSAECDSLSFVVEEYFKETGDVPLAPLVPTDFIAESSALFNATQEPVGMTIQDDDGVFSGAGGGGAATVDVPFRIDITGASVSIKFDNLPQPFETSFNGTISGDVLPG